MNLSDWLVFAPVVTVGAFVGSMAGEWAIQKIWYKEEEEECES